ncbi:hypothetical protein BKA62DRAFT_684038 [Auriculariales sp. MPI-PUGE-AT-0066]|nr:hypothetical protein BKA62DRAFT_684038 [Auriculariales sp. MPI-PUGE-AT-0066]
MSISLEIVPCSNSIDIHGSAPAGLHTAYSLSGHVLLTLSPAASTLFDARPSGTTRVILTSLELLFEGKAELAIAQSYTGTRVFRKAEQLLPNSAPIELECDEDYTSWQVTFNLALPGWLPASVIHGEDDSSGVSYSLFARATYHYVNDSAHLQPFSWLPWKLASFCASTFASRDRTAGSMVPIFVNRYPSRPAEPAEYAIKLNVSDTASDNAFPPGVLSNLEVMVSIPSYSCTTDQSVPASVSLRFAGDTDMGSRLRVSSIQLGIVQNESSRRSISAFGASYPVPAPEQQPPNHPLLDTHPLESLYALSLLCDSVAISEASRSWSVLDPNHATIFTLDDPDAGDGSECRGIALRDDAWHKITLNLPILSAPASSTSAETFFDDDDFISPGAAYRGHGIGEKQSPRLPTGMARKVVRPSCDSPLFTVKHEVRVTIACTYGEEAAAPRSQFHLSFVLPMRFALPTRPASTALHISRHSNQMLGLSAASFATAGSYPRTSPLSSSALPAYSQLFHANGDWRDEVYAGLPAYSQEDDGLLIEL